MDSFEETRIAMNKIYLDMINEEANICRRSIEESKIGYKKWFYKYLFLFFIPYCIVLSVLFYYIIFVWCRG